MTKSERKRYKELFEQSEAELINLTNVDKRMERIDDLKDSYNKINDYMMEAEDEKLK